MPCVPIPPTDRHTCRLPRLASTDAGSAHPACACPGTAPMRHRPGPVCLPSVLLPLATGPEYLRADGAYVRSPSCLHRSPEAPFFRGLDALAVHLAVHSSGTWLFLSTITYSQLCTQRVVDLLPHAAGSPSGEVPVDHLPGRQVTRQHTPCTSRAQQVEYGISNLSQLVLALSTGVSGWREQWLKQFPLRICEVAGVRYCSHTLALPHPHHPCQGC